MACAPPRIVSCSFARSGPGDWSAASKGRGAREEGYRLTVGVEKKPDGRIGVKVAKVGGWQAFLLGDWGVPTGRPRSSARAPFSGRDTAPSLDGATP